MIGDLAARRDPDVTTIGAFLRDFVVRPCAGRTAVAMGVAEYIEDDDVVRGCEQMTERIVEHIDKLPRRASPSHSMREVVYRDRRGRGDEIAFRIGLQVSQIVVERVPLPFVAVADEPPERVVTGSR